MMGECNDCLWWECPQSNGLCEDFSPVSFDIEHHIEEERKRFYGEWFDYLRYLEEINHRVFVIKAKRHH